MAYRGTTTHWLVVRVASGSWSSLSRATGHWYSGQVIMQQGWRHCEWETLLTWPPTTAEQQVMPILETVRLNYQLTTSFCNEDFIGFSMKHERRYILWPCICHAYFITLIKKQKWKNCTVEVYSFKIGESDRLWDVISTHRGEWPHTGDGPGDRAGTRQHCQDTVTTAWHHSWHPHTSAPPSSILH